MSTTNITSMKDLIATHGLELPKNEDIVTGEILSIGKNAVLVDLGSLGTGIVYPGEFYDKSTLQKSLKPGQQISAVLLNIENEEGFRELSLKRAQITTAWEDIKARKDSGEILTTKIANINKGGLIVEVNGVQGFLPLSQLAPEKYPVVEGGDTTKIIQALQKFRGQDIQVKIIDFSEEENRLIVSEKAINDALLKEEVARFKVGDIVEGEISDVTDFGAFVKLNDVLEGLIHISEIDWKLVKSPKDVLSVGQTVKAKIIGIDNSKVALSLKALRPDPWENIDEKYSIGQSVTGKVAKITAYGVIIHLNDEVSALIPMSELGDAKPSETYKIGDDVQANILSINAKEHKVLLTIQKINKK